MMEALLEVKFINKQLQSAPQISAPLHPKIQSQQILGKLILRVQIVVLNCYFNVFPPLNTKIDAKFEFSDLNKKPKGFC